MTFPGCPAVFYGDEIGLSGGNDPDCRLAMEWDEEKQDKELLALYRKLIGIRRESPSLLRGDFRTCLCDDASNVYAFRRTCGEDESLVVLNAGSRAGENENRRRGDVDAPHQRQKTCILGKRRDHR